MLGKIVHKAFWDTYDYIGLLLLGGLIWTALVSPAAFIYLYLLPIRGVSTHPALIALVPGVPALVLACAACGGLLHFAGRIVEGKDASLSDIFYGMRRYWLPVTALLTCSLVGLVGMLFNLWFYMTKAAFPPVARTLLAGLSFWITVLFVGGIYLRDRLLEKLDYPTFGVGSENPARQVKSVRKLARRPSMEGGSVSNRLSY